jgi:hypothetical protein
VQINFNDTFGYLFFKGKNVAVQFRFDLLMNFIEKKSALNKVEYILESQVMNLTLSDLKVPECSVNIDSSEIPSEYSLSFMFLIIILSMIVGIIQIMGKVNVMRTFTHRNPIYDEKVSLLSLLITLVNFFLILFEILRLIIYFQIK